MYLLTVSSCLKGSVKRSVKSTRNSLRTSFRFKRKREKTCEKLNRNTISITISWFAFSSHLVSFSLVTLHRNVRWILLFPCVCQLYWQPVKFDIGKVKGEKKTKWPSRWLNIHKAMRLFLLQAHFYMVRSVVFFSYSIQSSDDFMSFFHIWINSHISVVEILYNRCLEWESTSVLIVECKWIVITDVVVGRCGCNTRGKRVLITSQLVIFVCVFVCACVCAVCRFFTCMDWDFACMSMCMVRES